MTKKASQSAGSHPSTHRASASAKGDVRVTVSPKGSKTAKTSIDAMYSMSSKKGLQLLKDAGIVTPTNRLARFYR